MTRLAWTAGLALALFASAAVAAEFPSVVAAALDAMPVEFPADLAYTMEIDRNGSRSTERYDPARPPAARWILLARDGREPTAAEFADYLRQRARVAEPGFRASFRPDQVDRAHAEIVSESPSHLAVRLRFSESAVEADRLLGQLDLTVLVRKETGAVASYRLKLRAPYAAVLGVKMHALDSGAELDEAGRPRRTWSRFQGRIFLRSVDERIEVRFRDFAAGPARPDR